MGYLIDILIGAASRMVTSELSAHVEPMARWIIGKAVQRFPADDRNRFREEWLAHLDETPGTLRKLWHANGCYLGAAKVAGVLAQQPPAKEAARMSPAGGTTNQSRSFYRRTSPDIHQNRSDRTGTHGTIKNCIRLGQRDL